MIAELNASREAVEAEKAAMKAEVEAEREKTSATKNKYTQQLNAMEEEFEEIKTNILRTAGKIDSLKSKLPNDEEAEWKMMNDLEAVDFPAAEIEIESIVETPATYEAVAVEEVVVEPIAEEPVLEEETFTLEDLTAPEGFAGIPDAEPVEEFSLEDIEIELPELEEATEAAEEAPVEELDLEEISFEGLEELFKEEN